MNIITLNRVLLNNTPLNYRRKRILTEKDFYFKTIERTFTFSKSAGGKSIKDGRAYIKRIKGNSVVWNQKASFNILVDSLGIAEIADIEGGKMITLTQDYTGSADYDIRMAYNGQLIAGHVYCVSMETYSSKGGRVNMDYGGSITNRGDIPANTWSLVATIGVAASDKASFSIYPNFKSVGYLAGDTFGVRNVRVTDLTQLSQAGNEPSTIEDFYARVATLGVDLNAYNKGEVIHMNTESIKSVGDNAWDEEWGMGRLNTDTGQVNAGNNGIYSKNYIKVLPNETYYCGYNARPIFAMFYDAEYNLIRQVSGSNNFINIRNRQFTTPANAVYMRFYATEITSYSHDICIRLAHTGYKTDYEPYWQDTLPLPIIRKYFPDGMKSAGSAHDEIRFNKASGKWEYTKSKTGGGKIKSVDMGDMAWSYDSANQVFTSYTIMDLMTHPTEVSERNKGLLCSKYSPSSTYVASSMDDKSWLRIPKSVTIKDTSYTDAATFKAAMAGVILYYEAAEWEWVELDAEDQNFRDYYNVADFGTEQSQSETPSAALLADVGYYFKKSEVKELTLN